jgi:hypothetical protein
MLRTKAKYSCLTATAMPKSEEAGNEDCAQLAPPPTLLNSLKARRSL